MPIIGFARFVGFRAREQEIAEIDALVKKHRNLYNNRSHFVRAAVVRALREKKEVQNGD